jgi:hypothetical protein
MSSGDLYHEDTKDTENTKISLYKEPFRDLRDLRDSVTP